MNLRPLLLLALALAILPVRSAPLRVAGSDLLLDTVGAELTRFASANELEIALDLSGSRSGLASLQSGSADFALLVFGAEDARPGPDYIAVPVGYFTAVVLAPASVSISQLHFGQLAAVFGANESLSHGRWGELGVTGPWSSRAITAMVVRRPGLALDLFRYNAMASPELKSNVVQFDDLAPLLTRIGSSEGGLAIVAVPPPDTAEVKVLLVAKTQRDVAYGPSPENLHSGDYPLRLPVHLVFRQGDARRLNFVLRHLLSDEMAPVFRQAGVITLPIQARNQLIFDLENR